MKIMVRIYSFRDLMLRLNSPEWAVSSDRGQFFFVPGQYRGEA